MGTAPLGLKLTRRISRDVGEPIKRAVGSGGYVFDFVTFDHRHGSWSKVDGGFEFYKPDEYILHWSSCRWNFDGDPVPEHLCGARITSEVHATALVCAEPAETEHRHRCGSETWE